MSQLYVTSMCSKIEVLICHINSGSTLGKIVTRNLNWIQLHSGLSSNILATETNINCINRTWFHPIKEFLNTINVTI
jgi:hypothetical protein